MTAPRPSFRCAPTRRRRNSLVTELRVSSPLSATGCEIVYSMRYEFASRVIGKLLEPLFDQIADTMVDAFTRRADDPG